MTCKTLLGNTAAVGVEALVGIFMPFVGEVEVHHRSFELGMPQVALYETGVHACFKEMGGRRMATLIDTLLMIRRWPRSGTRTIPSLDKR